MLEFASSPAFTLGIEIEFQVLDQETLALAPGGPIILAQAQRDPTLAPWVKPEYIRSMIEIVTPVCRSVEEAHGWLRKALRKLFEIAEGKGYRLYSASLHPFSKALEQKVWEDVRYQNIREELQIVGRPFISQGLHIHVGMPSAGDCLKAYRWLRLYLPLFLALTTSSPFYEGEMTGLYSYRSKLFEALPLAGYPRDFKDYESFAQLVETLLEYQIIQSSRDLWWDLRPHPLFGTLELRVCDLPSKLAEILGIATLARAYLMSVLESPEEAPEVPQEILRYNKWQAARHGLDGYFVDPVSGRKNTFREMFKEFLFQALPRIESREERSWIGELEEVLERGTSAHRQIDLYLETGDFRRVIQSLGEEFWT